MKTQCPNCNTEYDFTEAEINDVRLCSQCGLTFLLPAQSLDGHKEALAASIIAGAALAETAHNNISNEQLQVEVERFKQQSGEASDIFSSCLNFCPDLIGEIITGGVNLIKDGAQTVVSSVSAMLDDSEKHTGGDDLTVEEKPTDILSSDMGSASKETSKMIATDAGTKNLSGPLSDGSVHLDNVSGTLNGANEPASAAVNALNEAVENGSGALESLGDVAEGVGEVIGSIAEAIGDILN